MSEGRFDVVWPSGNRAAAAADVRRRNDGLAGARIGFAWDFLFKGDKMWEVFQEELRSRYPDITFVDSGEFPNIHDKFSDDVANEALKRRMRELDISAAIIGVGA